MTLPLAASPTSPTPGLYLTVNLNPTSVSPGYQALRGLIMSPKNADGDITANTEVATIASQDDIETEGGVGSLASLAYAALISMFPSATIDYVAPAASGGNTAAGTLTWSGTLTTSGTAHIVIQGVAIDVPWNVGEDADAMKAKVTTYCGLYAAQLFATVTSAVGAGVNTVTANCAGPAGNDITLRCTLEGCAGGSVAVSGARLTGGTTEPDFTTALATVAGTEYDFILPCLSNADAASTTGNGAKVKAHMVAYASGLGAKLQQAVIGYTGTRTAAAVSTAALNSQAVELICSEDDESLPCELAGYEMGDRMAGVKSSYNKNRIASPIGVKGSPDPTTDAPTTAESDAALLAGVSLIGYDAQKSPIVLRAITTFSQMPTGAAVLPTDCNEIDSMFLVAKDLRAYLPVEFRGAKLADDSEEPDDELPEGVTTPNNVRASIIARIRNFWIPKGVVNKKQFEEDVESGNLAVQINAVDETQLDIFIPLKIVKNLAKMGVYTQKVA